MTTLEIERAEQRRWQLRPSYACLDVPHRLVTNEFLPAEVVRREQQMVLRDLLRFAAGSVPFYQRLFAERGWDPDHPPASLSLPGADFPVLTRREVQENSEDLMATPPFAGGQPLRQTRTAGTTGQPVRIKHSPISIAYFEFLKQRECRWFRFDPARRLATIKPRRDLPAAPSGRDLAANETVELRCWREVGSYFITGPALALNSGTPVDAQAAWLKRHRPDYLIALSADLEHLALVLRDEGRALGLRGIEAISQQVTPEMRLLIEDAFGVPLNENYGLNEFGLVASRCPEGGRFHVHPEFCLLEILDDEGRPCAPNVQGRIVVSTLVNRAMPLFRYDADDLAEWPGDPCPCGRTSPAFVNLTGRYRRKAGLPAGTWELWTSFQRCLRQLPPEVAGPLRQFQMHQDRQGAFELKVVVDGNLSTEFSTRVRAEWAAAGGSGSPPLTITLVDGIPKPAGGKFQDFVSDWTPPPGAAS